MADTGDVLIVIPARGGSKRLPRKNVLPLAGKPLICWTIEAALEASLGARIVVTSDNSEILSIAQQYKTQGIISHKRPGPLASDTATTASALIDVLEAEHQSGFIPKTVILLQPTSPLRSPTDIVSAFNLFNFKGGNETVVSVCKVEHPTAWVGVINESGMILDLDLASKRSQDYHNEYRLNGAVYVCKADHLENTGELFTKNLIASIMPRERSLDIDCKFDFDICEWLVSNKGRPL